MSTHSFIVRSLALASALAIASPLACGGKSTGGGPGGGSSGSGGEQGGSGTGGDSGSSGSGGTSGSVGGTGGTSGTGVGGSGGSSGTGVGGSGGSGGITIADGGGACVDVNASDFDTSCNHASDCTVVPVGNLCTGGCECTGGTIDVKSLAKYDAAVASIVPAECPCPFGGVPACYLGQCILCTDPSAPGCGDGGTTTIDAGPPTDGGFTGIDGGGASLNCYENTGGTDYCYSYEGLTSSEESAEASACTSGGGKVLGACPTAGVSGCCEDIAVSGSSISYGYCIYGVSASSIPALKSACASDKGTWSK